MANKINDLIRVKKQQAKESKESFELRKGHLKITQINKHLNPDTKPSVWFDGLLYKGVQRSNV